MASICSRLGDRLHLDGDLFGNQKIVRIRPLNIISVAQGKGPISGSRSSLVLLHFYTHRFRRKSSRNREGSIGRSVIDNNNPLFGQV